MTTTPNMIVPDLTQPKLRKIKVGMVLERPFPGNARVEREAKALVEAGYEVHLLCELPEKDAITPNQFAREDYYNGIYIHRVSLREVKQVLPMLGQTRVLYEGLVKSLSLNFFNRDNLWYTLIDRFVHFYGLDLLHIHGLRLVDTGLAAAKKHNLPVIADLHEHYPAAMEHLKDRHNPAPGLRARRRWEEIEERCLTQAAKVIVPTDEARERLLLNGVSSRKVAVVPDTIEVERFTKVTPSVEINRQYKPWFMMAYAGPLTHKDCGIETVFEALSILKPEIPELFFVVIGAPTYAYGQELDELIDRFGLHHRVQFTGALTEADVVHYLDASDLCLMPLLMSDSTNGAIPESVYLYHLFKKPVITSDCVSVSRYVSGTHSGLVYPAGSAEELANQIRRLYYDTELKKVMGENGQHAVLSEHNWRLSSAEFAETYAAIVQDCGIEPVNRV